MLGDRMRAHRRQLSITQEELATASGVGVRTIRDIEAGRVARPRPGTVRRLAAALRLGDTERQRFYQSAQRDAVDQRPPAPPAAEIAVPRQLPAPPQMFTGRADELASLERCPDSSTVVITAIDGMAGVGKTALALHAAHRVADRYPHGQLFIDLHGYTPGLRPVEPAEALERMLRTLGIAGEHIPARLDERAALLRSRLADQRLLILLDNAAAEAQVAPLLPGTPGCLVLVTSRGRLSGLDHRHAVSLDTLPLVDAVNLFARTIGEPRLATEPPELVAETAELCGRLPLAIRVAAARLRSHPTWTLTHLVARLRDHRHRLAELADGQRSVTAALELSYQQLTADQQRTYRYLGLHPGPDFDEYAAAALAGAILTRARRLLDRLLDAHLLQERAPGRYTFHDLVGTHAHEAAHRDETGPARQAAQTRLLDHYRHTALVAMDVAHPYEPERRPRVAPAGTPTPDLPDPGQATGWLDNELPNLLAAARLAAEAGWPEHALDLSVILHRHLRTRGRYREAEALHQQGLAVARATGHRCGELAALLGLGDLHRLQSSYRQATDHYQQALAIARATGNRTSEPEALFGLGDIRREQGRHEPAATYFRHALEIARGTGHRAGELDALLGLGHVHRSRGGYDQALDYYRQALALARATGHRSDELTTLRGLGDIHLFYGRHELALERYHQMLEIARATGHRTGELSALLGLGDVDRLQDRHQRARDQYGRALEIARSTGHRTGELGSLIRLGHIDRRQGRHQPATKHYQRALDLGRTVGNRNMQFEAIHGLGRLHHATGQPELALAHHRRALDLATELRQPADQARAHDGIAHAQLGLNQPGPACQHWQHALAILTGLGTNHTEDREASAHAIRAELARAGTDPGQLGEHPAARPT